MGSLEPTPPQDLVSSDAGSPAFNPDQTVVYQTKFRRAPRWVCSFLASNDRERMRLRAELGKIKGALPLLMKVRNGGNWTSEERSELKRMMRSASSVSPYLLIWALPGSLLFLPFLAWHLDARRKERERETTKALS